MSYDPLDPNKDPFAPPAIPTLVHCIHCGNEYDSYRIEWRVEEGADGRRHGFWCCPMPGCDGKGFGFDIFPVDPEYRDENGELMWSCDEEDDEWDDEELAELEDDELEDEAEWFWDEQAPSHGRLSDRDEDIPF